MTIAIPYFYKEAPWKIAFNGNNSKIVIAKSGAVYKDFISPFQLVNDENGVDGFAGISGSDEITVFANSGNGNAVLAQIKCAGGSVEVSGGTFTIDEWIHAGIVYSAIDKTFKLYIDGKLVDTTTSSTAINPFQSIRDAFLGRNTNLFITDFNLTGFLDDFRIYDKALTDENISDIHDFGRQFLQFEKLRFVTPKSVNVGRSAIFKFTSNDFMQIRNFGVEFKERRVR